MPRARSRAISASTCTIESRPRRLRRRAWPGSMSRMSYHARMRMPLLIVTGAHRRVREHEAHRGPVAARPAPARSARSRGRRRPGRAATSRPIPARGPVSCSTVSSSSTVRPLAVISFMSALWRLPAGPASTAVSLAATGMSQSSSMQGQIRLDFSGTVQVQAVHGAAGTPRDNAPMPLPAPPLQAFHPAVAAWFAARLPGARPRRRRRPGRRSAPAATRWSPRRPARARR